MILVLSKDNFMTVLGSMAEAERQPESEHFTGLEELSELAANWPASRLVEIWNNLPGVSPIKKFTDRKTAVSRIWKALQELNASGPVQAETPQPEAEATQATKRRSESAETTESKEPEASTPEPEQDADVAPQAADVAPEEAGSPKKTTRAKRERTGTPREGSKADIILSLLKREGGASLQELMDAAGWQKHSVRGFLAGTVNKKMGLNLTSKKEESGERRYFVAAQEPQGGGTIRILNASQSFPAHAAKL